MGMTIGWWIPEEEVEEEKMEAFKVSIEKEGTKEKQWLWIEEEEVRWMVEKEKKVVKGKERKEEKEEEGENNNNNNYNNYSNCL